MADKTYYKILKGGKIFGLGLSDKGLPEDKDNFQYLALPEEEWNVLQEEMLKSDEE
jgi:hypothetical protein